jgi:hydrogenase maturation protease
VAQSASERTGAEPVGGRPNVMMIGLGNALAHDDAAGLVIARRLRASAPDAEITVHEHEGETLALLDIWQGADAVVLVDAIRSGAPPGTIRRFDATSAPIPSGLRSSSSTHAFGVGEAIELARALSRLPKRVVLLGIEGRRFNAGSGLSDEVEAMTPQLLEAVSTEARRLAG